jgi:hypothetical protein
MNTASKQMQTSLMHITPEMAVRWLEGNVRNRKLDQSHVDRLAADMRAGRWKVTHQGIAFSNDGVLADGQHRLWAIMLSNCTVPMMVSFNVPSDCIEYVDGGKARTSADRMNICGKFAQGVNNLELSTLRTMVRGFSTIRRFNFSDELQLMLKHKQAIDFACRNLCSTRIKGVSSAISRAVIARAWYSADVNKLIRFCEVLKTGIIADQKESVIVLLRDSITIADVSHKTGNIRAQYGRTERALRAFLNGESLSRIYPVSEELFPLPDERKKEN